MKKIILAFSGTGKSEIVKRNLNKKIIDLDTSNFKKKEGWETFYVDVALAYQKLDYLVLLCWHNKNIINELNARNCEYVLVFPAVDLKEEYINRYKQRGDTEDFANSLEENWDKFINDMQNSKAKEKYELKKNEFLFECFEKLSII